jgi:hypothetical protein
MKTKTFILLFFMLLWANIYSFSQYTPKGMSYQAVARDEKGFELKSQQLEVKISIIALDPAATAVYAESHSITTDKYGLFTLIIGQGSYISGTAAEFSDIDWGTGVHFLKIEVDFGYGFRPMGTTQFLAVPYALYAGTAANTPDAKDDQVLSYDPVKKELSLEKGGQVDLSDLYEDSDPDSTNEIQTLSYSNHVLSLSKANSVTIDETQYLSYSDHVLALSDGNKVTIDVNDADSDPTNEIQDLQLDEVSNVLSITKNPTASPVYLQRFLDNTDNQTLYISNDSLGISGGNKIPIDISNTNEIQTLSRSGDSILLSLNGGSVIDNVDDADHDPTNELQSPRLIGDNLSLTNDPNNVSINLNKYLDNTDDQAISRSGYNLSIEGGNTINIRPEIVAFRALKAIENSKILYAGDSTILVFANEKIDLMNGYNSLNGKFVVPAGGEGLYHFDLIYQYSTGQSLKIFVNGAFYEQVIAVENYPFIIYLNANDTVEIQLKSSGVSNPQAGVFSGYRIH